MVQVVRWLLAGAGREELDRVDSSGRSALLWACEAGQVEVVKLLLGKGAKVEVTLTMKVGSYGNYLAEKSWPLSVASRGGHLALVSHTPARILLPCQPTHEHHAVSFHGQVDMLLPAFEWSNEAWAASLEGATINRHVGVVARLLDQQPPRCGVGYDVSLGIAAKAGDVETVTALLTNVSGGRSQRRSHLTTCARGACEADQVSAACGLPCRVPHTEQAMGG